MGDLVTIPAERLAKLESVEAAAGAWLSAWVSAQSVTSATDNKTALAFDASKRLAAVVQANPSR